MIFEDVPFAIELLIIWNSSASESGSRSYTNWYHMLCYQSVQSSQHSFMLLYVFLSILLQMDISSLKAKYLLT